MKLFKSGLIFALLGVWSVGCGIPKEQHDKALAKNKALQNDLSKMRQDKESMQVRMGRLEKDLSQVKAALDAKKKALDELQAALDKSASAKAELARIKAKMAAEKALNDRLRRAFRGMISAGQLRVVNVNGRLVIKMASRILFAAGQATLTAGGKKALWKLAKVLAKVPRHFQVAGHTDNKPIRRSRFKDNWLLSATRASNVVQLLLKEGVPGENLSAAAFGEFQPVASNRTRRGQKLNRRIEITLLPVIPKNK